MPSPTTHIASFPGSFPEPENEANHHVTWPHSQAPPGSVGMRPITTRHMASFPGSFPEPENEANHHTSHGLIPGLLPRAWEWGQSPHVTWPHSQAPPPSMRMRSITTCHMASFPGSSWERGNEANHHMSRGTPTYLISCYKPSSRGILSAVLY